LKEQGYNHLVVKAENYGLAMFLTQILFVGIYPELLKKLLLFSDSLYNGAALESWKKKMKIFKQCEIFKKI
jgi:hypothetical protein